jgi:hypothetical protein
MNGFMPRTEPVASSSSVHDRAVAAVRPVSAVPAPAPVNQQSDAEAQLRERSAAKASYARLQADIATVIARLDPPRPNGADLAQEAERSLAQLMPQPVVVLPLPPTDQDMIDFVAQVAQSVASQAALARAAHARVSPAMVEVAAS